jgi:hypothetical protein
LQAEALGGIIKEAYYCNVVFRNLIGPEYIEFLSTQTV